LLREGGECSGPKLRNGFVEHPAGSFLAGTGLGRDRRRERREISPAQRLALTYSRPVVGIGHRPPTIPPAVHAPYQLGCPMLAAENPVVQLVKRSARNAALPPYVGESAA